MGLIIKAAYIEMCKCGRHGNIILADGKTRREFYSKEDARKELLNLFATKAVDKQELTFLDDQVSGFSELSPTDKKVDLVNLIICDFVNTPSKAAPATEDTDPRPKYIM